MNINEDFRKPGTNQHERFGATFTFGHNGNLSHFYRTGAERKKAKGKRKKFTRVTRLRARLRRTRE
jgi:hypothetical protein